MNSAHNPEAAERALAGGPMEGEEEQPSRKNQALVVIDAPELQSIEASKAKQIKATFEPMVIMLAKFEGSYIEVINEAKVEITGDITAKAKRLRIDIGKVRIATEKLRVAQKAEYLRAGQAIDGVSNILKWAVGDKEAKLKEIEDHFEIENKKRLDALQIERAKMLENYIEDAYDRNLADMEEDVWNAYCTAKKKEFDDRIAAEAKAEADRIAKEKAEAKEREHIRKENERLKAEAEERNQLAKIEQDKREKAEAVRLAQEQDEREKREEAARKVRVAHEEQLRVEREEREQAEQKEKETRQKLEDELKLKKYNERMAVEEAEAKEQAHLNMEDVDKIAELVGELEALKTAYTFKSAKNKRMFREIGVLIDNAIEHIQVIR